ncbi:MAG TPA: heavy metal translocating P-type ATPase [Candidatus Thalassarchaeaceae archaeon]|jgi:Cd2+/Zn2+-exporting ATPase|nr:heavy metal translocating P-type ATPase [Candidatus Thalassarchaeaceae archaeon]|tara:strand:+ start:7158 stop:9860 length:2703 start_codon:yes stop_codon:yes gene_type:complete
MSDESEDFLFLDDEDNAPDSPKEQKKPLSLPKIPIPRIKQRRQRTAGESTPNEVVEEADISLSFDGNHTFDWGIRGMDCPDCAMKATRAVSRLPGVESCKVSVADGTVELSQDVSRGTTSRASAVLSSLGHTPDVGWLHVVGANPEGLAAEKGLDIKMLRDWLNGVPGVLDVRTNDGRIEIQRIWIKDPELRDSSEEKLSQILGSGFRLEQSHQSGFRKDQINLLSAILTIPLILIIAAIMAVDSIPSIVAWVLALGGVAFAGSQLFMEAWASLSNRVVGFQVLTSLAIIGAVALGELIEALMVVALVSFASHLENRALIRARESMQGGLDRLPRRARLVTSHSEPKQVGSERTLTVIQPSVTPSMPDCHDDMVPVEALEVGEMVEVRSGETVPVDGVIVEGTGAIDRAPLTGEPIPIPVKEGDRVEAGLTLTRGPLVIKSEATGEGTRLSSLIDLVRHYKDQPTRTQSVIERFTLIWTPLVVLASPIIAFASAGGATEQAVLTTLLLWVVSCPCSLLLASPVPHAAALTTASSFGLIARGGDVLESASEVELAMLDKTGTLTSGKPTISGISSAKGESEDMALGIAAGMEIRSNHPYARTIIQEADTRGIQPSKVGQISDGEAGVVGTMDGKPVMLGRPDWLRSEGVTFPKEIESALKESRESGRGASVLSVDGTAIAAFGFAHDDARDGVLEAIDELRSNGVKVEILSGDEQASVEAFAREIGIDPSLCRGGVDPEGKAKYVTERSVDGHTLMAGDGFNDAGALAAADLGVAIGSGDQVNLEAADVLIPGQDPRALSRMVVLAKRTRKVVWANIAISVTVTLTLVFAVIMNFRINLAAGIALHEASAIIIILNGMWVSGSGTKRLSTLTALGRDLVSDMAEIASLLLGREAEEASATA